MTEVQPMKMAAAEALYTTEQPASFSILTIGTLDGSREVFALKIPYLLSFLGTGDVNGRVEGINDLQAQYVAEFGPGSYTPIIPVTYWRFRLMIGFGVLAALVAALGAVGPPRWPYPRPTVAGPRRPGAAAAAAGRATPSAGSSPRWAASRGSSSARCSPATASPAASRSARC